MVKGMDELRAIKNSNRGGKLTSNVSQFVPQEDLLNALSKIGIKREARPKDYALASWRQVLHKALTRRYLTFLPGEHRVVADYLHKHGSKESIGRLIRAYDFYLPREDEHVAVPKTLDRIESAVINLQNGYAGNFSVRLKPKLEGFFQKLRARQARQKAVVRKG